jgi:hypothetical protein
MAANSDALLSTNAQIEQALPAMFADRLKALADRQGISLEEALAQAIRLDEIVLDAKNDDAEVLLVKDGQKFAINFR